MCSPLSLRYQVIEMTTMVIITILAVVDYHQDLGHRINVSLSDQ